MVVLRTDADNLLGTLDSVRELGIYACDECVSVACLNHHHTEVVTLEHLVVCLLEGVTLTLELVRENLSITLTTVTLTVMTEVYDLNAIKVELEFLCLLLNHLVVTEKDRSTETLFLCLNGSLDHCWVETFCEYHALWVLASCLVEVLCNACLLSHTATELTLVCVPVCDRITCHTAIHSSLCYGSRNLCDKTWVNWLWNEVVRTECEVVHVVCLVHYVWNWLLSEVCDSVNGSNLHLLVDGASVYVEGTTEDVREADYVIDLVWIVRTAS